MLTCCRLHIVSGLCSTVTLHMSRMRRTVFDIDFKKCSDLENRVTDLSRSLEMSSFNRVHTTSYRRYVVVTTALPRVA